MIKSFRHKGLEELFTTGGSKKIRKDHHARCLRRLDTLNAAETPEEMNIPGFRFHGLQGALKRYAVSVTGNYRITFEWEGKDAHVVDYEDYH
jgi:proteic killer suppression protein